MVSVLCADDATERKHVAPESLLPPAHPPSESPSLSPQPPLAPPPSNLPAGVNTMLDPAISSASQPLQQPHNPAEGQAAHAQMPTQEQQPQLWPLTGAALAAAAAPGQPLVFSRYIDAEAA